MNAAVHINSLRVLDRNFDTVTIAWNLGVSVAIPTPPRGGESSFPDSIGCHGPTGPQFRDVGILEYHVRQRCYGSPWATA